MQAIDRSPVQPGIVTRKAPWKWDLDWCVYGVIQSLHPTAMHLDIFCSSVMWWIKGCEESEILNLADAIWCCRSFLVFPSVSCPHQGTNPGEPSRKASLMASRLGDGSWKLRCRTAWWLKDEVRKLQNQRPLGLVMTGMASWMLERPSNGWCGLAKVLLHKMIPAAEDWWRSWGWTKWIQTFRRIRRTSRGGLNLLELKNEAMTAGTTLVENDRPCFTDLRAVMFIKSSSAVHLVLKYDPPRWLCLKIGYLKIWYWFTDFH